MNLWLIGGVAVVIGGLSLASYGLYQRSEAAIAKLEKVEADNATLTQAVKDSEEVNDALRVAARVLDETITQRDARWAALVAAHGKVKGEYDALKKSLPKEDQACFDRPLPPAVQLRLN